jgi:hypothetical protein
VQRRPEDAGVEAGGCDRIRHDDVEVLDAEIRKRQTRLRRYALAKRQDAGQEHQSTYDADHESDHAILPHRCDYEDLRRDQHLQGHG